MDSLTGFLSQKDEIARLNKQINMMADFYSDFYESQIKKLKAKINSNAIEVSRAKNSGVSKVKAVLTAINEYNIDISNDEIAEICFVSVKSVIEAKSRFKALK